MEPLWGWRQIKGLACFPALEEHAMLYNWEHSPYEYPLVSPVAGGWGELASTGSSLCSAEGPALWCLVMGTYCACYDPRIIQSSFLKIPERKRKSISLGKKFVYEFIYSRLYARVHLWNGCYVLYRQICIRNVSILWHHQQRANMLRKGVNTLSHPHPVI